MAKKSKAPVLTDKNIETLADMIVDTRQNVYDICLREFKVKAGDETFDRLKAISKIFHCDNCSTWMACDNESPAMDGWCNECEAEIHSDEEDE